MAENAGVQAGGDDAELRSLGYETKFDRQMSMWENFALGFTYLSPVVGVYSVFGFGLATGGPPMIWAYFIAAAGQFLVCLIFCEVVSQFPIAGGCYSWARRLVGKRWAWMNGWFYMWALLTSVAAVSVGAGPFLGGLLGLEASQATTTIIAVVLIALATVLNLLGTKMLARIAMFGFICELVGAIAVGAWLLLFRRVHDLGVFFDPFGVDKGGSYLPAFLAAALVGLFTCYGFEACGDVAEEIHEPGMKIPKAMRMTIYVGMSASVFVCGALILATPDIALVVQGKVMNPVESVLRASFGMWGARAIILVVLVSFVSCLLSLEAAVSRLMFAYGRDGMVAGSRYLAALSPRTHIPSFSIVLSGVISSIIAALGYFAQDALTTIIGFAVIGIYITFQMIVLGALIARMRGWKPSGHFRLGQWATPINVGALIYGVAAIVNMMWPRTPDVPWYTNYSALLTSATVLVIGSLYMIVSRAYDNGSAPSGDAWTITDTALAE